MSDEGRTAAAGVNIHLNHDCSVEGCGKWGGFGFAKSGGGETVWWCWPHYPYKPNQAQNEAAMIADAIIIKV